ncbi:hypothetical protein C731_0329 [Mycolicibacterium hassiacum DSM 44199]|uniref:Uncharacterized protein n=1 Tax=Mycolicibacterium hassiacum (strain DSM 44199 / CIP 105218 / JCM 12690 / 3849) TaxID=1122247 RepID=K5BHE4_MYCHD|nr:hypothetical protein C731_0329 [Mycolicibacterium hassiacum DSM 44199]
MLAMAVVWARQPRPQQGIRPLSVRSTGTSARSSETVPDEFARER